MTRPQRSAPIDVVTVGELKEYLAGCASDRVLWAQFPPEKTWYHLGIVSAGVTLEVHLTQRAGLATAGYLASVLSEVRDELPVECHYNYTHHPTMVKTDYVCKGLTLIKVPEFTLPWVPAWLFCVPAYIEVTLGSVRANITAEARRP